MPGDERADLRDVRTPDRSTRSALLSTMTGVAPLSERDEQVSFDPARVVVAIEPGDEEDDVDVRGDDLLFGAIAGGAAREAARARQHRRSDAVAVRAVVLRRLDADPVADGREIRARRGVMPQPA